MALAQVVPFPNDAAAHRAGQIEEAMNEIGAIINGLDATLEGEQFLVGREFLLRQLDRHYTVLRGLLFPGD